MDQKAGEEPPPEAGPASNAGNENCAPDGVGDTQHASGAPASGAPAVAPDPAPGAASDNDDPNCSDAQAPESQGMQQAGKEQPEGRQTAAAATASADGAVAEAGETDKAPKEHHKRTVAIYTGYVGTGYKGGTSSASAPVSVASARSHQPASSSGSAFLLSPLRVLDDLQVPISTAR